MLRRYVGIAWPAAIIPVCISCIVGCSESQDPANPSSDSGASDGRMGDAGPGRRGPGGRMNGRGGGHLTSVAADATAPQIFQLKCQGCHGEKGQGANGPNLSKVSNRPQTELRQIIHNGHGKMPAFANQMTETQIDQVAAYVKQLGASS